MDVAKLAAYFLALATISTASGASISPRATLPLVLVPTGGHRSEANANLGHHVRGRREACRQRRPLTAGLGGPRSPADRGPAARSHCGDGIDAIVHAIEATRPPAQEPRLDALGGRLCACWLPI